MTTNPLLYEVCHVVISKELLWENWNKVIKKSINRVIKNDSEKFGLLSCPVVSTLLSSVHCNGTG